MLWVLLVSLWMACVIPLLIRSNYSHIYSRGTYFWVGSCAFVFIYLSWLKWGISEQWWISLLVIFLLLTVSLTDVWFGLIPNRYTYSFLFVFFCMRMIFFFSSFTEYLLGLVLGGGAIYLLATYSRGMGIGDAKLIAVGGLIVGFPDIFLAFWLATISASLYLLLRWLCRRPLKRRTPFPFGPHISIGIYFVFLYGDLLKQTWQQIFVI